jgi:O-antigen/teichoic acid export membrane protein
MNESANTATWSLQYLAAEVSHLRKSKSFRGSAVNAAYSLTEYVTQPVLMIVSAPFLLSRLGVEQYGIWMLVSVLAGTVGIFQIGLGDATVKYVSSYRGRGDSVAVTRIINGILALSVLLGGVASLAIFLAAPFCARHVFKVGAGNISMATISIRIGGLLLWAQCVFAVFSNALKAHEVYGPPVKITAVLKGAITGSAVLLVASGHGVVAIMIATLVATLVGIAFLIFETRRMTLITSLSPKLDRTTWNEVIHFGMYSWLQNAAGLAFSQADKLLVAAMLGTGPLTYYTLCVQVAQQIHGLPTAAFSFLFPHISAKYESGNRSGLKRVYRLAILTNLGVSLALTLPVMFFSKWILTLWLGPAFAGKSYLLLSLLALGFFMLSLNVAPHFTLLGMGKVRFVSIVNLVGGAASLVGAALLMPSLGLMGAAVGRLLYGPAISANFWKVEKTV